MSDAVNWRRLERQVTTRIVRSPELSVEARLVLLAAVQRRAGGAQLPPRRQLGRELGLRKHCMSRAVGELAGAGLVRIEGATWALDVELVERWAAGARAADFQTPDGPEIGPQASENQPAAGTGASLVEPPAVARATARTREADLELAEREAVRALQDAGFRDVSRADREELGEMLRAGVPLDDIRYAARECNRHRVRTLRYLEVVLDRLHDEAAARPQLVELGVYRGGRTGA